MKYLKCKVAFIIAFILLLPYFSKVNCMAQFYWFI